MATFHEIETPDGGEPQVSGVPPGVSVMLWAAIGLVIAFAVPYLIVGVNGDPPASEKDGMARIAALRLWAPGDPAPFAKHFRTDGAGPAVAEAGAMKSGSKDEAVEGVGALVALTEGPGTAPVVAELTPVPPTPEPAPVEMEDNGSIPVEAPPKPPDPFARIALPASTYADVSVLIEDPHGAMGHFYERLGHTALKDDGAITRIAQFGDSAIAADGMPSSARELLQTTFGDAGHGFSLIAGGNPWYRRKNIAFESKGWRTQEFIRRQADDHRYGFGGVGVVGYQGARAKWQTVTDGPVGQRASRFEIYYAKGKRHGQLQVKVDGAEKLVIDTEADEDADAFEGIEVNDGPHTFEVRNAGGGITRLFGVVVERDVPGIVYDSIGVVGARAARQLFQDEAHFQAQLRRRNTDLFILMYGGNALTDKTPIDRYRETFAQVVDRFRGGLPEASCLVMSPIDHGEYYRRKVRTVPRQHRIMKAQRRVALEKGCAWFSIYDAMGGEGSIGAWNRASPKLASSDLAHPTGKGSQVLGTLFYRSLMRGFADYLAARKAAGPP